MKHGGGGVMVWGCFAGYTVGDLFRIQGTLNHDGYHKHSAAICHPIWFALSGTLICFSIITWPNTPPGCVRAIWPRWVMECCIRWPGLHNHLTSTQLRWFVMNWTAEWWKSSQQVLSTCGNTFKTVGKAFQVKLVERMPRVCKAVIKAKRGYFEQSKRFLGYYMIPYSWSLHTFRLESLKLVFQPLHKCLVNKLKFWQVG